MKLQRGISDDTPESTVRSILEIIKEEATTLGASVERETKLMGITVREIVDVSLDDLSVRFILDYVDSADLHLAKLKIGSGTIVEGRSTTNPELSLGEKWAMRLLPADPLSNIIAPPFSWGLYPQDANLIESPTHILDGRLLRSLLRERLLLPPPA
jgi:hypothetical protein